MTFSFSSLDNVSVVSIDGSFFGLNTAYLVDTGKLDPDQLAQLNEGSDSDLAELAEEVGIDLEDAIRSASVDVEALDIIARTLSGSEWTADMFDAIADLVRATGREIQDA